MNMLNTGSFFDLSDFPHTEIFPAEKYVWTGLNVLKEYMNSFSYPVLFTGLIQEGIPLTQTVILHNNEILTSAQVDIVYGDTTKGGLTVCKDGKQLEGATVIMAGAVLLGRQIKLGNGVLVESGAMIKSPTIIGDQTEVRQGAYLRGYCLTGRSCVLGHTTEVKHSIFLNNAKAGHFAYLGDSILGNSVNLGAGTKFANLRFFGGTITIRMKEGLIDTGRRKFGAILGDDTQTGCNSVTSPGTLIGKSSFLLPNTTTPSGYHPPRTVIR
jgi:UDP-N-acetylglucosamine diphosphorylase / glucose-1-phosphate thymidylyltransferase / UDP-N-acetylgalactosamine diphosphorylase / glucosamine-1-phosphate N-acetyltransferase / galactosamine-1-phosphate N-acetyltransferase